jgi:hypothetical protein
MRNTYKILVRKHEEKRSLWNPGHKWDDNIKMDLTEMV